MAGATLQGDPGACNCTRPLHEQLSGALDIMPAAIASPGEPVRGVGELIPEDDHEDESADR